MDTNHPSVFLTENELDGRITITDITCKDLEKRTEKTELQSDILEENTGDINTVQHEHLYENNDHATNEQPEKLKDNNQDDTNSEKMQPNSEQTEKLENRADESRLRGGGSGIRTTKNTCLFTFSSVVLAIFVVAVIIGKYIPQIIQGS